LEMLYPLVVARMERSAIRESLSAVKLDPDCAALHPGYKFVLSGFGLHAHF